MRLLIWLLRAFLFFVLFAFTLNNQQTVTVRWFFGLDWQAPLVFVLLVVFGLGCGVGVLAMVPAWWRNRKAAAQTTLSSVQPPRPSQPISPPQPPSPSHSA